MTENVMVRMKQNLAILGLRNTHENIDEYLENAIDNSSLKGDYSFSDLVASLLQGDWEEGILKIQENVKDLYFQFFRICRARVQMLPFLCFRR